jgi:hypothetical protein
MFPSSGEAGETPTVYPIEAVSSALPENGKKEHFLYILADRMPDDGSPKPSNSENCPSTLDSFHYYPRFC